MKFLIFQNIYKNILSCISSYTIQLAQSVLHIITNCSNHHHPIYYAKSEKNEYSIQIE